MIHVDHELRPLLRAAVAQGCRVARTRRGHLRLTLPSGRNIFTGSTPSDARAVRNLAADLRRGGCKI